MVESTLSGLDPALSIFAVYLSLNALVLLLLSYRVGSLRGAQKMLYPGATGDATLQKSIRAHANYAEYAPLVMMLLLVLALKGTHPGILHAYGTIFTLGRVSHYFGMMRDRHPNAPRFLGNFATGLALLVGPSLILFV